MTYNRQPKKKDSPIPKPSSEDLKRIIQGDTIESARETVKWAQRLGEALKHELATSQIRNIFGTVRQIEMNWPTDTADERYADLAKAAERELILLEPKLRYQAKRVKEQKKTDAVEDLADVIIPAIEMVKGNREYFQRFVDFFEAILAYHKAAGGKD